MALQNGAALIILALLALGLFLVMGSCKPHSGKHHHHDHHRRHDREEYTSHTNSVDLSSPEAAPLSSNSAAMSLNGDSAMPESPDLFQQYGNTWQGTGFGDCRGDREDRDQSARRRQHGDCEGAPDGFDSIYVSQRWRQGRC